MVQKHSLLRIYMLKELEMEPKTGYQLLHVLAQYNGGKKPSSGTVYPHLKELNQQKLISYKTKDNKKIYALTTKGKTALKQLFTQHKKIMDGQMQLINQLAKIDNKKTSTKENIDPLHNPWIQYNANLISELKHEIFNIMKQPFNKEKADIWAQAMKHELQTLKKIRK